MTTTKWIFALIFSTWLTATVFAADRNYVGLYAHGTTNAGIFGYYTAHKAEIGEPTNAGFTSYVHYLSGNVYAVKAQDFSGGSHGAVTMFDTAGQTPWYMNPVCVPFNNPGYDVQYGGAHDMDVKTPLGTPITSIVSGTVSSVTHPIWGWQIGIKLDQPIRGAGYFSYLHLGAVKPGLAAGQAVAIGDLLAYSGGANSIEQMNGHTNTPFGPQFIDAPSQSSQPQTGFALMRGPEYGVGAGWTKLPDPTLDPTPTLKKVQAQYRAKMTVFELNNLHGFRAFYFGHNGIAAFGPPTDNERATPTGSEQNFARGKLTRNSGSTQVSAVMESNPGQ